MSPGAVLGSAAGRPVARPARQALPRCEGDDDDVGRWACLAGRIESHLGLDWPERRHGELRRRLRPAARALGFECMDECVAWLLARPWSREVEQVLATQLAIGETFFHRHAEQLAALREHALAPLVATRRADGSRRLRLWSAACSSGEEAYTLAMIALSLTGDEPGWQIEVLGTDLRAEALERARAGLYGDWSFRGVPPAVRRRWFEPASDGRLQVRQALRRCTRFEQANLVGGLGAWQGAGFDLILCRNTLMYFAPERAARAASHLRGCLREGGWLVVGPSELECAPWHGFERVQADGVTLLRRATALRAVSATGHAMPSKLDAVPAPPLAAREAAAAVLSRPAPPVRPAAPPSAAAADALAALRALADGGRGAEALRACEALLAVTTPPDAGLHHLHAMILAESGAPSAQVREALERALYCDDRHVLAHFALGHLALAEGRAEAARHAFAAVQRLLADCPPGQTIGGTDGMTAAALAEAVAAVALKVQAG